MFFFVSQGGVHLGAIVISLNLRGRTRKTADRSFVFTIYFAVLCLALPSEMRLLGGWFFFALDSPLELCCSPGTLSWFLLFELVEYYFPLDNIALYVASFFLFSLLV